MHVVHGGDNGMDYRHEMRCGLYQRHYIVVIVCVCVCVCVCVFIGLNASFLDHTKTVRNKYAIFHHHG